MRVYFYCFPEKPPEDSSYQHTLVALAEGLRALGVEVYANIDYWRIAPDGDFLLRHDPEVRPDDCVAVVLEHIWFLHGYGVPQGLFRSGRPYVTVFVDRHDGTGKGRYSFTWQDEFRAFDLILKTHYNAGCAYPSNVQPGAFGLTDRILREADARLSNGGPVRQKRLLLNFRVQHPLRRRIRSSLLPLIAEHLPIDETVDRFDEHSADPYHYLHWRQTGMRHNPVYFDRLATSAASACFGGMFIPNWPRDQFAPVRAWHRIANKFSRAPERLMQWDSWRLWESLAFGCATFHVDLEKYGARLPVMPRNWHHYIGIDLDDLAGAVERIASEPGILERVGRAGREWALEHYGPIGTARRFLETIGLQPPAGRSAPVETGAGLSPAG